MTLDATQENLIVGVIGAGAMGRGIAQVAATGGCTVKLFDTRSAVTKEAIGFIEGMFNRAVEKKRMSSDDLKLATNHLHAISSMSELSNCHVIIEAAVENLDIKRKIFAELESIVADDVVLASNTSSLSITTIASQCANPERVAGFH